MVMCAYDEARGSGQKHSAAVALAVDFVRQRYPEMPISKTEVKRILATFRPESRRTILQFKRSTLDGEKLNKLRWLREQSAGVQDEKGLSAPSPSIQNLPESRTTYKFAFAERPLYPRHNRKIPKE